MKPTKLLASPKFQKVIGGICLLLLAGGIYLLAHAGEEHTDDAVLEAHVVPLSAKVPGYVTALHVVDNQQVKAGDVLLEIDPADYLIRVDRAKAILAQAKAAAEGAGLTLQTTSISAPSQLDAAKAQVLAAEATWNKAVNELERMKRLSEEARSREQLDEAVAAEKVAHSNLEDAKARLRTAQTAPKTIAVARAGSEELAARIKQAEAELAQAQKDLADTKVVAPQDGRIVKRNIEQGAYVQSGQTLGFIVGNDLWVVANFKETQIRRMKPGQETSIEVDAFPHLTLKGKVESIQSGTGTRFSTFPAENATGNFVKIVQRVPVKIALTTQLDSSLPLGPGMSVEPTVKTR